MAQFSFSLILMCCLRTYLSWFSLALALESSRLGLTFFFIPFLEFHENSNMSKLYSACLWRCIPSHMQSMSWKFCTSLYAQNDPERYTSQSITLPLTLSCTFALLGYHLHVYCLPMHLRVSSWFISIWTLAACRATSCFEVIDSQAWTEAFYKLLLLDFCSFPKTRSWHRQHQKEYNQSVTIASLFPYHKYTEALYSPWRRLHSFYISYMGFDCFVAVPLEFHIAIITFSVQKHELYSLQPLTLATNQLVE